MSAARKRHVEMLTDDTAQAEHHIDDGQATQNLSLRLPASGFLRLRQVLQIVPIGRSTLYQKMKAGTFPRAVKLGPRISAWRAEDIRDYITNPR
jgi:predicted DNA-binding transcriptional regulator AlpA